MSPWSTLSAVRSCFARSTTPTTCDRFSRRGRDAWSSSGVGSSAPRSPRTQWPKVTTRPWSTPPTFRQPGPWASRSPSTCNDCIAAAGVHVLSRTRIREPGRAGRQGHRGGARGRQPAAGRRGDDGDRHEAQRRVAPRAAGCPSPEGWSAAPPCTHEAATVSSGRVTSSARPRRCSAASSPGSSTGRAPWPTRTWPRPTCLPGLGRRDLSPPCPRSAPRSTGRGSAPWDSPRSPTAAGWSGARWRPEVPWWHWAGGASSSPWSHWTRMSASDLVAGQLRPGSSLDDLRTVSDALM